MKIVFDLAPDDIANLKRALARARDAVRSADEEDLIEAARQALDQMHLGNAPSYIRDRIKQVQRLVTMLEDEAWALPSRYRVEVLKALVYFSDPEDLIPDHVPVIGYLDDAIMMEMLLRQERDLLKAYDRFCTARNKLGPMPKDVDERKHWCGSMKRSRSRILESFTAKRRRDGPILQ